MECNCGDKSKSSVWIVTTAKKIKEWLGFDYDKPVKVYTETCASCGRMQAKMFNPDTNELLTKRG